ncbi:hypothetical protein [Stutzerimonas nitrititolerans]|uniref:hypothetical protein n=1 Tax=Stutzerimonas nitrititolerans TaxID=2482751 RepID=UPI00289A96F2|nr:hypothetical protein [Stutzerimonas nitrititolerans]
MDNPYASKSSAHAAAFALTEALIARMDLGPIFAGATGSEAKGKKVALFVNTFFNEVLANLEKKQ